MDKRLYPIGYSRNKFEQIRSLLEGSGKKSTSRKCDVYEIFCVNLYLFQRTQQHGAPGRVIFQHQHGALPLRSLKKAGNFTIITTAAQDLARSTRPRAPPQSGSSVGVTLLLWCLYSFD